VNVTNLTSGVKILLRKKKIQVKITIRVMISAIFSGRLHQVMPQDSRQRILWESRKIVVKTRPIWNKNVTTVITGLSLQFLEAKGITQWKRDFRVAFRLMNGKMTFSFFARSSRV
jgi:hypothetical protein